MHHPDRVNWQILIATLFLLNGSLLAGPVQPEDVQAKNDWVARSGPANEKAALPFSFKLGGRSSNELLPQWRKTDSTRKIDESRAEHSVVWTDPKTSFEVQWVMVNYSDYPTIEWTVHFKNGAAADSPLLTDVQAIDLHLDRGDQGEFTLHAFNGSNAHASDYEPRLISLRRARKPGWQAEENPARTIFRFSTSTGAVRGSSPRSVGRVHGRLR